MRRTNFHLTEDQLKRLRAWSDKTDLSVAELIRRAVDAFLERTEQREKNDERTERTEHNV